MNKTKVVVNVIFSFLSSFIPLIILQLLILPSLAEKLGTNEYGISITIYSILTIIASSGNALNNVRLINERKYEEKNIIGDFNLLLLFSEILGTAIVIILVTRYDGYRVNMHLLFIVVASILMLMRSYIIVGYCIELNYYRMFINNIILTVGYFIGSLLMMSNYYWELIYIVGNLLAVLHLYFTTKLLQEGVNRTVLFKQVTYQYIICLISTILANLLNYIDKILIYPLLGGTAVSTYYVSTLIGKMILMAISPINSVLLSYMSKLEFLKKRIFYLSAILSIVLGIIGYFICILISKPCLMWLYPDLAQEALRYIKVVTLTAVVTAYISLLSPLLLKFCNINWQIIISIISLTSYMIIAVQLSKLYGLYGFAIGGLLANIVKLILMFIIYTITMRKMPISDF